MKNRTPFIFAGLCVVMVLLLVPIRAEAQTPPSSTLMGVLSVNDSGSIGQTFVDIVNRWLRRYDPSVIQMEQNHVLMTVNYDYQLNIELSVINDQYRITVTVAERRYRASRAQEICSHIVAGVNKELQEVLSRNIQAAAQTVPSATLTGLFGATDTGALRQAFVDGVNRWLRRYDPLLIQMEQNHVLMTVNHDYRLNVELSVINDQYRITVTIAEEKYREKRAQEVCSRVLTGVNNELQEFLSQNSQSAGRTSGMAGTGSGVEYSLERAVEQIAGKIPKSSRIAIVYVTAEDNDVAEYIANELEFILLNQEFTLIDRTQLDRIRGEQNFQLSGVVDDEHAVSIGKIAGAGVILTGAVTGTDSLRRLRLRVLDTQTAQVLGAASERY